MSFQQIQLTDDQLADLYGKQLVVLENDGAAKTNPTPAPPQPAPAPAAEAAGRDTPVAAAAGLGRGFTTTVAELERAYYRYSRCVPGGESLPLPPAASDDVPPLPQALAADSAPGATGSAGGAMKSSRATERLAMEW